MSDSAECRLLCEPSGATGQACQHTRPSSLLMHANQAEDEAAQTEGQQDQPCTPGHQQGEVQEQPCTPGLVVTSSACCALPRSCSSTGGDSAGSGLEAENSIRFRKRSKFEALKARREAAHQKAEAKQREQEEFVRRAECIRKLEARQKQEEEAAVKALGQQLLAHQSALAHIQYARTVARDKGWRPWQHLMQQAHCRMVTAQQWAQTKAVQHAFRSWRQHVAEQKQERARVAAEQQRVAEQHHRQVLVKGMWEGLGQAVALRRLAHRDAHRHFQLYRQRQVFIVWQQVQKQTAHARLLRELQLMHQAAMHHSKSVTQRTINAWAEAVIVSKEEAAMQARKEQTWNKIHSWLAEDPGGHTKLNAITEPAFLQDVLGPSSATDPLLDSLEQALMEDPLSSTVNKQITQGAIAGHQHMGEDEFTAVLGCTSVA
ncbi:MAG: hypothetical protein FRX49_05781 [Trebouxia sp. A1-2]|nr:MAG: hypothetical protein FRX49_05781 [Trebouxia sp. A1-2]